MSDERDKLENRFNDFEPEVDESCIEENWQKIKNILPEEKKNSKKGFYLLLIGFIFATGAGLLIYFNINTQNHNIINPVADNSISEKLPEQNNTPNNIEIENEEKALVNRQINSTNNTSNNLKVDNGGADRQSKRNEYIQKEQTLVNQNAINSNKSSIESTNSKESKNIFETSHNLQKTENRNLSKSNIASNKKAGKENVTISENDNTDNNSKVEVLGEEQLTVNEASIGQNNLVNLAESKTFPDNMLPYTIYYLTRDSIIPDLANTKIQYSEPENAEKKTKKLSLEFLAGPSFTTNKLDNKLNDSSYTKKHSLATLSGNIGINYQVKPKFSITAQYFYNQINYHSTLDRSQPIDVYYQINQTYTPTDTVSYLDTTKKYFQYNSSYALKLMSSHQFGFGVTYRVVDFKSLFLEAGTTLNLKLSTYNYSTIRKLNTDTMVYKSPTYTMTDTIGYTKIIHPSHQNYSDVDHFVKKDMKYSFGITPSISLGYNVNQKLSLMLKGSYYFDLGQNKIKNDDLLMQIKQNNLFLHFGLRIKL